MKPTVDDVAYKTRADRTRNQKIREECGITYVITFVRKSRRNEDMLIRKTRDYKPEGQRLPGDRRRDGRKGGLHHQ